MEHLYSICGKKGDRMRGKRILFSLAFCALVLVPVSLPADAGSKALPVPKFVRLGNMGYQKPLPGSEALIAYIHLEDKTINVGKGQPIIAYVWCSVVNLGFSLKRFTVTFCLAVDPGDGGEFFKTRQITVGPILRWQTKWLAVPFVAPEESGTYHYTVKAKLIDPEDGSEMTQERTLTLVVQ